MQKILEQYLLYKYSGEIDPMHISEDDYSVIKNLNTTSQSKESMSLQVYYYKIRSFLFLIEKHIKDRSIVISYSEKLKEYTEVGVNMNDKNYVLSEKEYRLKIFYDKFQTKEELEKELKIIYKN